MTVENPEIVSISFQTFHYLSRRGMQEESVSRLADAVQGSSRHDQTSNITDEEQLITSLMLVFRIRKYHRDRSIESRDRCSWFQEFFLLDLFLSKPSDSRTGRRTK